MTALLAYARMAENHWRQHCPRMVRQLQADGRLESALLEAQEQTLNEMESLMQEFRRQGLTSPQAHDRAWELVRERYLLIPPERE